MTAVPVHPVSGSDRDSIVLGRSIRIKLLDIATGGPLPLAYAEKPEVELAAADGSGGEGGVEKGELVVGQKVLDRRRQNPLRVVEPETLTLHNGGETRELKAWSRPLVSITATGGGEHEVAKTLDRTMEFFEAEPAAEFSSGGTAYQLVKKNGASSFGAASRYVVAESGGTRYVRRALVSDADGVLTIPVSRKDCRDGFDVRLRLRDYKVTSATTLFEQVDYWKDGKARDPLKDDDAWERRVFGVKLSGKPVDNAWTVEVAGVTREFEDEYVLSVPPGAAPEVFNRSREPAAVDQRPYHAVLWCVRRARTLASNSEYRVKHKSRDASKDWRGVVVHYTSGIYMSLRCGEDNKKRSLNDLFKDGHHALAFLIDGGLSAVSMSGKTTQSGKTVCDFGYNTLIGRDGEIVIACDESDKKHYANHAGHSREKTPVHAVKPGSGGTPAQGEAVSTVKLTKTENSPQSGLNSSHIGVCLLMHDKETSQHNTPQQIFYLDRLLENIRERHTGITWDRIQGHDEVRASYKAANPGSSAADKADPGDALYHAGMDGLRWRHKGDAVQEPHEAYLLFDGSKLHWMNGAAPEVSWSAVSGKPGSHSPELQYVADTGPLPTGEYDVLQSEYQERPTFTLRRTWPGGAEVWGDSRVWLKPRDDTGGRSGFCIHGGTEPGNAGGVDLTSRMPAFGEKFLAHAQDMILVVDYDAHV